MPQKRISRRLFANLRTNIILTRKEVMRRVSRRPMRPIRYSLMTLKGLNTTNLAHISLELDRREGMALAVSISLKDLIFLKVVLATSMTYSVIFSTVAWVVGHRLVEAEIFRQKFKSHSKNLFLELKEIF